MFDNLTAGDVMESVFDYPHVPYWFTVGQAIRIIKVTFLKTKKYVSSMAILVFDEKYNLIGILTLRGILKSIGPGLLPANADALPDDESARTADGEISLPKQFMERQVSKIMIPVQHFVAPDEPLVNAARIMIENDLVLLPVLENKRKLVGLVSIADIFGGIAGRTPKE